MIALQAAHKGSEPMRKLPIALFSTVLLWSGVTTAQQKPGISLVIEQTNEPAVSCGITKSGIDSIAALTLRNNGIRVASSSTGTPFMWIQVVGLHPSSTRCSYFTNLSVRTYISLSPKGGGDFKPRNGPVVPAVLCEQTVLGTIDQGNAAMYFSNSLENLIKLCLGELDY
jgi:hypothetical protein